MTPDCNKAKATSLSRRLAAPESEKLERLIAKISLAAAARLPFKVLRGSR
jgi:hypothetical protein